ncbi:MAG: hypothetical protein AAB531_03375 [Patescibacteria group bacterium]
MNTITIPKELSQKDDLIVLSRRDYEALLKLIKSAEFSPTVAQKNALKRAEKNLRDKKSLSYDELISKLDSKN